MRAFCGSLSTTERGLPVLGHAVCITGLPSSVAGIRRVTTFSYPFFCDLASPHCPLLL